MKKTVFAILILCTTSIASAQKNEIGFFAGGAYYIGDFNPATHFAGTRPAAGITWRRNFTENLALKTSGIYEMLYSNNQNSGFNKYGMITYKSQLIELSSNLEVDFFPFFIGSNEYTATPYIFGGLAGYYFLSSDLKVENPLLTLANLNNIGQPKSLFIAMPFGLGLKTKLGKKACLSFEWGMRKTFDDLFDHASVMYIIPSDYTANSLAPNQTVSNHQIGSKEKSDWYSIAGVHLTFAIKNKTKTCKMYESVK